MGSLREIVSLLNKEARKESGVQDDFHWHLTWKYIIKGLKDFLCIMLQTLKITFSLLQSVTSFCFVLHVVLRFSLYFVLCFTLLPERRYWFISNEKYKSPKDY